MQRLASVSVSGKGGAKEGNRSARQSPRFVALARKLRRRRPKAGQLSLREVSSELAILGFLNELGPMRKVCESS